MSMVTAGDWYDCAVLCWVGLGWVGLGWVGLGWAALCSVALCYAGLCCAVRQGGSVWPATRFRPSHNHRLHMQWSNYYSNSSVVDTAVLELTSGPHLAVVELADDLRSSAVDAVVELTHNDSKSSVVKAVVGLTMTNTQPQYGSRTD